MLLNRCFILTLSLVLGLQMNTAYAVCDSIVIDEWPDSRYTDHNNGTVTDNTTGLMWKQCSQGQTAANNNCSGTASGHTWKAALELASTESFAGHDDWRLPNVKEYISLMAFNCRNPSINETLFPNTPYNGYFEVSKSYWSSSPVVNLSENAWAPGFGLGTLSGLIRTDNYKVRLVRGGQ